MKNFTVKVLSGRDQIRSIEAQWRELFCTSSFRNPTLSWEWHSSWIDLALSHGLYDGDILAVTLWEDEILHAILPLHRMRGTKGTTLRFLTQGSSGGMSLYPEKIDLLTSLDSNDPALRLLVTKLEHSLLTESDSLELECLRENSILAQLFSTGGERTGIFGRRSTLGAPFADLTDGFEQYLSRLSANRRSRYRRILRDVQSSGARLEVALEHHQMHEFLEELMTIHQRRWSVQEQTGAFQSAAARWFHHDLISQRTPDNTILARLSINEPITGRRRTVAAVYGFIYDGTFDFYQSGVTHEDPAIGSPGIALHLLLMQYLANSHEVRCYDFLGGESAYKVQLATNTTQLESVQLLSLRLRSRISRLPDLVRRSYVAAQRRLAPPRKGIPVPAIAAQRAASGNRIACCP